MNRGAILVLKMALHIGVEDPAHPDLRAYRLVYAGYLQS
jgi:hypothetical protein